MFQIYGQLIFIFKANKRCHPSLEVKIQIQREPKIFCLPFNWNSSCDTLPLWDIVTLIIFSIEWNWNTERISSARGESDLCTINAAGIWRQKKGGIWTCSDFESEAASINISAERVHTGTVAFMGDDDASLDKDYTQTCDSTSLYHGMGENSFVQGNVTFPCLANTHIPACSAPSFWMKRALSSSKIPAHFLG